MRTAAVDGRRILLTGGTGFFGRALLRHWADAEVPPRAVWVLTRAPARFARAHPALAAAPWLTLHPGDILAPASLPRGVAFDRLLHAAADSAPAVPLSPLDQYAQIVDGTRHLLDFAVAQGIPRVLFVSSGGAYGPQPPDLERIPETYRGMPDPLEARNSYGVAKRTAEHLCALYRERHGLETVVARCFAFVGRDLPLRAHFAIGNFIRDALEAPAITVAGDGTPVRSYMDQRDLAAWLMALLERGRSGEAYNVGSDEAVTVRELAHLVRDIVAPDKPVQVAAGPAGTGAGNRYVPAIEKARRELGVSPTISLRSAIQDTARFAGAA